MAVKIVNDAVNMAVNMAVNCRYPSSTTDQIVHRIELLNSNTGVPADVTDVIKMSASGSVR